MQSTDSWPINSILIILVHFGRFCQYFSSFDELGQFRPILVYLHQVRSILVNFYQSWSLLVYFRLFWSIDQFRSILAKVYKSWLILVNLAQFRLKSWSILNNLGQLLISFGWFLINLGRIRLFLAISVIPDLCLSFGGQMSVGCTSQGLTDLKINIKA